MLAAMMMMMILKTMVRMTLKGGVRIVNRELDCDVKGSSVVMANNSRVDSRLSEGSRNLGSNDITYVLLICMYFFNIRIGFL